MRKLLLLALFLNAALLAGRLWQEQLRVDAQTTGLPPPRHVGFQNHSHTTRDATGCNETQRKQGFWPLPTHLLLRPLAS